MKMVPYEAFACHCRAGYVVLRESYIPKTRGKLYYACPLSKVNNHMFFIDFKLFSRTFNDSIYSPRASTTRSYSPRPSTPPSYSLGSSRNAECLNYKLLLGRIKVLEATVEMYMHPEQHTLNSTTLLHEVYNDMGKLGLE
ncbi:hypothetical protein Tco_1072267 [Tanacetum coccineum]